jgi:N4-gp56 family major capsid protein
VVNTNSSANFSADIQSYIATETLPLVRRQLVVYRLGDPLTLPKGQGNSYTATRFNRVPLPFQPLTEGSPPPGELMTLAQITATAQQWGDRIIITDVAELTIKHPLFKKAIELTALQVSETLERNCFNSLMGGTQVDYVGAVGSRASLTSTSVITGQVFNRIFAQLVALGAPRFNGDEMTDVVLDADGGGAKASDSPRAMPHYVCVMHPFSMADLYADTTIINALSYSDINRLYNYEFGEWRGIRFCMSNMVPFWTGYAAVTPTPVGSGGTFSNGTYVVQVTGSDTQNQYESYVAAKVTGVSIAASGSFTITTPNVAGYTFNVYVSAAGGSTLTNLGLCASGPSTGPLTGQAIQLPANTTVTITGIGLAQVPPAYPGNTTGLTVYPVFVFGRGAYGQVVLDDVSFTYLKDADKSDSLNQLRIVGWKTYYGTLIENQNFFGRIEAVSAYGPTFN